MKKVIVIPVLLSFLAIETTEAQLSEELRPYISPGLQIGYGFQQGMFLSGQVTFGAVLHPYFIPGLTLAMRKYKKHIMIFTDFQLALWGYDSSLSTGAGFGYGWVRPSTQSNLNTNWVKGNRVKLWGGFLFFLITSDSFKLPDNEKIGNLGFIGVLPIPFFDFLD